MRLVAGRVRRRRPGPGGDSRRALALATLLWLAAVPALAGNLGGAVAVDSQLIDRGIALGPRRPVLQAALYASPSPDWAFSVSAASLVERPAHPLETSIAATRYWTLSDDWRLQAFVNRNQYRVHDYSARFLRYEGGLGGSYRDLLTVAASVFRTGRDHRLRHAIDLSLYLPARRGLTVSAGLGAAEYPVRTQGTAHTDYYGYGQLGLLWRRGAWSVELDRIATFHHAAGPYFHDAATWNAALGRTF